MARQRKVPLVYGKKRVLYKNGIPEIVQSIYCGKCNRLTQSVTIQVGKMKADRENISRTVIIGRACTNSDKHKDGENYVWLNDGWIVPRYQERKE